MPGTHLDKAARRKAGSPDHHVAGWWGKSFNNPWSTWRDPNLAGLVRAIKEFGVAGTFGRRLMSVEKPTPQDYRAAFPVASVDFDDLRSPPKGEIQCMWVGHATALVQMDGATYLTDPVFSERCSASQHIGPKRVVPPPFDLDDSQLCKIDFVVISHDHYDHLDTNSVAKLNRRFGGELRWYVPLGLKQWFQSQGVENVIEMDWWEKTIDHPTGLEVTFTPCQHWTCRSLIDRKKSLWGSWMVCGDAGKVWFGGDTGYCPVFKEIGDKFEGVDLALIPIGAYNPRWFLKFQHVDPKEAVQIHKDLKAKNSVGIHCCTFSLSLEPMDEPPKWLKQIMAKNAVESNFLTLRHGGIIRVAGGKMWASSDRRAVYSRPISSNLRLFSVAL